MFTSQEARGIVQLIYLFTALADTHLRCQQVTRLSAAVSVGQLAQREKSG